MGSRGFEWFYGNCKNYCKSYKPYIFLSLQIPKEYTRKL